MFLVETTIDCRTDQFAIMANQQGNRQIKWQNLIKGTEKLQNYNIVIMNENDEILEARLQESSFAGTCILDEGLLKPG